MTLTMGITGLAAAVLAGPAINVQIGTPPPPPPPVVVQPAAPAVTVAVVPDYYVWDGEEYVGVIGDQYYYLGPNNVWLTLDAPRQTRFHEWEKSHSDWRQHEIRNTRYRRDAQGHDHPWRGDNDNGQQ